MKREIKSEVIVKPSGNGFIIEVADQFTHNTLAVTKEELKKIVLYGAVVLKSNP